MTAVPALLAPIREREQAATEGPWSALDAQIRHTQIDGWVDPDGRRAAQEQTDRDIEFVKNARTDIPRLLAALDGVEAIMNEMDETAATRAVNPHIKDYYATRIRAAVVVALQEGDK